MNGAVIARAAEFLSPVDFLRDLTNPVLAFLPRALLMAVLAAVDFAREHLGVEMQHSVPVCSYSARNSQCIGKRCPFSAAKQRALEAKTAPSF